MLQFSQPKDRRDKPPTPAYGLATCVHTAMAASGLTCELANCTEVVTSELRGIFARFYAVVRGSVNNVLHHSLNANRDICPTQCG